MAATIASMRTAAPAGMRVALPARASARAVGQAMQGPVPSMSGRLAFATRPARHVVRAEVSETDSDVTDDRIIEYCDIKKGSKKSQGELESEFLEALRSFYYDGKPSMSNEEFDNLKDELMWEGSMLVSLSTDELRLIEAKEAYYANNAILSDKEFDALRRRLLDEGSRIALEGPRCSLRSRRQYSDAQTDVLRMTLLNVPGVILSVAGLFLIDGISGFKITQEIELPLPWGPLIAGGLVLPALYKVSDLFTNGVLNEPLVLKGQCPNCGEGCVSYFGDILTVKGEREENTLKCENCKSTIKFIASARQVELVELAPEGAK